MNLRALLLVGVLAAGVGAWGCGSGPAPEGEQATDAPAAAAAEAHHPYTAEEIRDEWVEGLTVKLQRNSPQGRFLERWTVVGADAEGVDIEYATLDPQGNVVGEPDVQHSSWSELRDHASFVPGQYTRQEMSLETPLGTLEGWHYSVHDDGAGTVTEFFFAKEFPGPPVGMRILKDDAPLMELAQVERHRPESAPETAGETPAAPAGDDAADAGAN